MLKKLLTSSIIGLTALSSVASANYITANSSEESQEYGVSIDMYTQYHNIKKVNFNFHMLDHDEHGKLYSFGVAADNFAKKYKYLKLTAGMKAVWNDSDVSGSEYMAIPFGLEVDGIVSESKSFPVGVKVGAYYAPSFLTLKDADQYLEYKAEVYTMVTKNIQLYGGFRNIETDLESGSVEFDSNVYAGLKIVF